MTAIEWLEDKVKQFAIDFAKSLSNFELFVIERQYSKETHIVEKSKLISHQLDLLKEKFALNQSTNFEKISKNKT